MKRAKRQSKIVELKGNAGDAIKQMNKRFNFLFRGNVQIM